MPQPRQGRVERLGEDAPPTYRRLVAMGRWPSTPPVLVVDWDRPSGAWHLIGQTASRDDATSLGTRERILAALSPEAGQTEDELADLIGVDKRKVSAPLRALVDDGSVDRTGAGRKGDPYRYQKLPPNAAPGGGRIPAENAALPYRGAASAKQHFVSAPKGSNGRGRNAGEGCISHPDGPAPDCRYCQAKAVYEDASPEEEAEVERVRAKFGEEERT